MKEEKTPVLIRSIIFTDRTIDLIIPVTLTYEELDGFDRDSLVFYIIQKQLNEIKNEYDESIY